MQPKLIKTEKAEYTPGVFNDRNESGWEPQGERVLVLTDQCAEQSSGGVFLDPNTVEKMTTAAETGILVAYGPDAFVWTADRTRRRESPKPEVGSFVYIERYAGQLLLGDDGQMYRLMDDRCIGAIRSQAALDGPASRIPAPHAIDVVT